jgi:hypothetical protein
MNKGSILEGTESGKTCGVLEQLHEREFRNLKDCYVFETCLRAVSIRAKGALVT